MGIAWHEGGVQTGPPQGAALVASGHRVLRFTYGDVVFDGATVVQRLRGAAARAA
jgi:hypothetical protein